MNYQLFIEETNKAISFFFSLSVLLQFSIVKPTHQPGEKTNKLFKKTKLLYEREKANI
jgi:hypothetical protein